jgi:hypothetical protein
MSAADVNTDIRCPSCRKPVATRVRIAAETPRRAGKRPATPELVHVCPGCGALVILALLPALREETTR